MARQAPPARALVWVELRAKNLRKDNKKSARMEQATSLSYREQSESELHLMTLTIQVVGYTQSRDTGLPSRERFAFHPTTEARGDVRTPK